MNTMNPAPINICRLIKEKLDERERSVTWLARKLECDRDNLHKTLKNKIDVHTDFLFRISVAMREDFFACYSEKIKEMLPVYYDKNWVVMNRSPINICRLIKEKLGEQERSVVWLARRMDCPYDNLRKTLKNNRDIHTDLLFNISVAMEEDFFSCYSGKLKAIVPFYGY